MRKPSKKQFNEMALDLVRGYAPEIRTCKKCHHPVLDGYECSFCKTPNPYWTKAEEKKFEQKYEKKFRRNK